MGPAFKIGDELYPIPTRIRIGDSVLVKEVTGLETDDFAARLDAFSDGDVDMLVMTGMLAIAVWQMHPRWPRERVRRFVEDIEMSQFHLEGGDEDPPAQADGEESRSRNESDESTRSAEDSTPDLD